MKKAGYWFLFLLCIAFLQLEAQELSVVSGTIINSEDNSPLPFASVTLKNHPVGTVTNEMGQFDFYLGRPYRGDTLFISYIGFNAYEVPLSHLSRNIEVALTPSMNVLDEVLLTMKDPLDYLRKALEKLPENYPQEPYESLAYYREKFIENGAVINREEAVFKTYHTDANGDADNQHQLLLYKPEPDPQQFQFMREWLEKKKEKKKKKAIRRGEEFDEEEFDSDLDMDLGGPESVIDLDIRHDRDNYLNPKYFDKYEYWFGEETSLNGERLVTIHFKAKKTIDHKRDQGKILINTEDYAIVSIEQQGRFSIPLLVKPILFAIGLSIDNPSFETVIRYQKYRDKWYPELFRWDADVKLTKRHAFSANEHSAIQIGQVFSINALDQEASPIREDYRFDPDKDMGQQQHNDMGLEWTGMNTIKD